MSHLTNTSASLRPVKSLRGVLETLEPRLACAIDIAPAIAVIGEVGGDDGATGRAEDGIVAICAPISGGAAWGSETGSEPVVGDDMLLTVTAMPFSVTMVNERARPARVPPVRGGLAQALAVRPAVMHSRGVDGLEVATTTQQNVEDRSAAMRVPVTPPAARFVRQITARLDRLAFARFGR